MLTYHPAFDIYHTTYRYIRLLCSRDNQPIEAGKISILDFYLVFPTEISAITLPRELRYFIKTVKHLKNPYNTAFNKQIIYKDMEVYQQLALDLLQANSLLDKENLKKTHILLKKEFLNHDYLKDVMTKNSTDPIINFLANELGNISLYGKNGLKARTRLKEIKYDAD